MRHSRLLIFGLLGSACGARSALLDAGPLDDGAGGQSTIATGGPTSTSTTTSSTTASASTTATGGNGGAGGTGATGGAGGVEVDLILSITPDSGHETTTDLKVAPDGTIVVAWVANPTEGPAVIGYAFSKDDGLTFTPPARIQYPMFGAGGPALAINAAGEVFLTWYVADSAGDGTTSAIFAARAAPGETAFGEPTILVEHQWDSLYHPRLGITPNGTLLESFKRPFSGWIAARSTDGVTWEEQEILVDADDLVPCALAEGATPAGYAMVYTKAGTMGILLTEDEGLSWTVAEELSIDIKEPRCVQSTDNLAVAGPHDTISFYVRSGPPGSASTWWIDKATFQFAYQFFDVGIGLDGGGKLDLSLYTHSQDIYPAEAYRLFRQATSGETAPELVFAKLPLDVTAGAFEPAYIGKYTGLAARGEYVFTSYADNSSGVSHIAFHREKLP